MSSTYVFQEDKSGSNIITKSLFGGCQLLPVQSFGIMIKYHKLTTLTWFMIMLGKCPHHLL